MELVKKHPYRWELGISGLFAVKSVILFFLLQYWYSNHFSIGELGFSMMARDIWYYPMIVFSAIASGLASITFADIMYKKSKVDKKEIQHFTWKLQKPSKSAMKTKLILLISIIFMSLGIACGNTNLSVAMVLIFGVVTMYFDARKEIKSDKNTKHHGS